MKGTTFKVGNTKQDSTGSTHNTVKLVLIGNTTPTLANIYTGGTQGKPFTKSVNGRTVDITLQNIGSDIAQTNQNFNDTDAFLLTFGYSSRPSFDNIKTWYTQAKRSAPNASVVLLGIKETSTGKTAVTNQDVQQLAKELHINTFTECALDNPQSITKALDKAVTIGGAHQQ